MMMSDEGIFIIRVCHFGLKNIFFEKVMVFFMFCVECAHLT